MKKVSGKIKLDLAQFRELEAFMQFAQDLDADTKARIDSGQRLTMTLRQRNGRPMSFAAQAVSIYAAVNGYLEKVATENVPVFEEKFLTFIDQEEPTILKSILEKKELTAETEELLKKALTTFVDTHPELLERE
jgi:F-type H+-transporting ATPase subunit alpha